MKILRIITALLWIDFFIYPTVLSAQKVLLEVPPFSQGKDAPWADESLGNQSSVTIRTHGCALTSISMVVSYFSGDEVNPSEMNQWLQNHNGYEDGWDRGRKLGSVVLNWPSLTGYDDGLVYTRFDWDNRPADLVLIRYYLDHGVPVIAEVLYRGAPHYIVLTGYDSEGFLMNDPEFPDSRRLDEVYHISDQWGSGPSRNIYGIRVLYPGDYKIE